MAIFHVRNQQSGQQGSTQQDDKKPVVTNPPTGSTANPVTSKSKAPAELVLGTPVKASTETSTTSDTGEISLDLDLSSVTEVKPEKISNEDLPIKSESADLDLSLDLGDSPAKEPDQSEHTHLSEISIPEKKKAIESVPIVEKEEPSIIDKHKEELVTTKEKEISVVKEQTDILATENSTSGSATEEKLSLDLPTDRSEKKDGEWLEKEDKEVTVETPPTISVDNAFSLGALSLGNGETPPATTTVSTGQDVEHKKPENSGLDLQAISMQKIQQTENKNTILEQKTTEVVSDPKQSTTSGLNAGGMMNLDDLGGLRLGSTNLTMPIPATTQASTIPVNQAPVSQPIPVVAPVAATNNGMMLDLDAMTSATPPVALQPALNSVGPEISVPPAPDLSNVNQEINASYDAISTTTNKKKRLHSDISKTRKIASLVFFIVLMLGGGFYIFQTMFPDKYQAIFAKKQAITESKITVNDNTPTIPTTETSATTSPTPAIETKNSQVTTAQPTTPQTTSPVANTGEIKIEEKTPSVVTVAGLSGSNNEHASAELTGDDETFDPFAEVEKMLEEPDLNQDKIDKLNELLEVGKEYNDLGELAEDASIIKYSKVLTQKIPTDLALLTGGDNIDLAKIDQHIKLFENYIKRLEAIAPLE